MTSNISVGTGTAHSQSSEPRMIQMLTEDGNRVESGEYDAFAAELTDEDLRGFYRDMILVRRIDAEGAALQRQGQLGLWAPMFGQEAAQIGMGRAARPQDFVFPTYREHGLAYTRGVEPETLLSIFRGQNHGGWDPQEHRFHTYTIVIGSQALHATGYAMGVSMDGDVGTGDIERDTVSIACFGDGATSQGDVSEALTFAGAFHAPVLFFCQNNQWAISEPTSVQTAAPLCKRGEGFGVPGLRVDGNDIIAMYAVARASLDSVRAGNGPMLIEAFTYRRGAHTTADDPTKYRDRAEEEIWEDRDPITRLKAYLDNHTDTEEAFFAEVDAEADTLAARIRHNCMTMQDPDGVEMFAHVTSGPHSLVDEERAEFLAYQASFADAGEA